MPKKISLDLKNALVAIQQDADLDDITKAELVKSAIQQRINRNESLVEED